MSYLIYKCHINDKSILQIRLCYNIAVTHRKAGQGNTNALKLDCSTSVLYWWQDYALFLYRLLTALSPPQLLHVAGLSYIAASGTCHYIRHMPVISAHCQPSTSLQVAGMQYIDVSETGPLPTCKAALTALLALILSAHFIKWGISIIYLSCFVQTLILTLRFSRNNMLCISLVRQIVYQIGLISVAHCCPLVLREDITQMWQDVSYIWKYYIIKCNKMLVIFTYNEKH